MSATSPDNQKPERASTDALQQLARLLARQAAREVASAQTSPCSKELDHAEDPPRTVADHRRRCRAFPGVHQDRAPLDIGWRPARHKARQPVAHSQLRRKTLLRRAAQAVTDTGHHCSIIS